ncbi:MAG: division/cell wall cluster transcriptional repressor MraZ [Christensenellales bacterium]
MFFGKYFHSLDNKGRLRLPSKLKVGLGETVYVTQGTNGCLFVFPESEFSKLTEKLAAAPMFNSKIQAPLRMLLSSGVVIDEDNQGRFLLPSYLREFAALKKNVVFVGVGNRVELWSEENWNKNFNVDAQSFDQAMEALAEAGL